MVADITAEYKQRNWERRYWLFAILVIGCALLIVLICYGAKMPNSESVHSPVWRKFQNVDINGYGLLNFMELHLASSSPPSSDRVEGKHDQKKSVSMS